MRQKKAFRRLPIGGHYPEPRRRIHHKTPECPVGIDENTLFKQDCVCLILPCEHDKGYGKKPLKTFLVTGLSGIRAQGGEGTLNTRGAHTEAREWLESQEFIEPIRFDMHSPYAGQTIYQLTPKAHEFLSKHEAPEYW